MDDSITFLPPYGVWLYNSAMTIPSKVQPGRYRHYKGNEYEVLGVAAHSETEERLVVYRCLYGGYGLWVRPLAMFTATVMVGGHEVPRFAPIADGSAS
jgi:hypothetical protein